MFDKKTEKALSKLNQEDLFKVSKMIQKLANKKTSRKTAKKTQQKKEENADFKFLHKIESKTEEGRGEPVPTEGKRANLFDKMPEKNHQAWFTSGMPMAHIVSLAVSIENLT